MIYWMIGLSGAGKSTIAQGLKRLHLVEALEGDACRRGLCRDLGYSPQDRTENLRRIAHLAVHLSKHTDVIVACITPYESVREMVRSICGDLRFIYVNASVAECRRRDPKGLYAKADRGDIADLSGVGDAFEPPRSPDLVLDTEQETADQSIRRLLRYVQEQKEEAYSLFIGRWQPFHMGHDYIIRKQLKIGKRVAIAVRDTVLDDQNPFPLPLVIESIQTLFKGEIENGRVAVFPIVDIESINIGRAVGYDIISADVPEAVASFSATEIRRRIREGEPWAECVPAPVLEVLSDFEVL